MNLPLLEIADTKIKNRLLLGSSGFPSLSVFEKTIIENQIEVVTIAIRRLNFAKEMTSGLMQVLNEHQVKLLPNTAGCFTAKEAILTAQLARESLQTNWLKLEVIGDRQSLYPDSEQLLLACKSLVQDGFQVFAYTMDDPIICQKLADLGCAAIMPLGSPIGSGRGILNPYNIELITQKINKPVILDAGIGSAKDVIFAMELGVDAVLVNSAIAKAFEPSLMAKAMISALDAGFMAKKAGRIAEKKHAINSTSFSGRVEYKPLHQKYK